MAEPLPILSYLFTIGLVDEFGSKKICDKVLAHEIKDCSRLPY
jgi:hypothetical protein